MLSELEASARLVVLLLSRVVGQKSAFYTFRRCHDNKTVERTQSHWLKPLSVAKKSSKGSTQRAVFGKNHCHLSNYFINNY